MFGPGLPLLVINKSTYSTKSTFGGVYKYMELSLQNSHNIKSFITTNR